MPDEPETTADPVDAAVEEVMAAPDDDAARRLEAELVAPTDNGWRDGDPVEQPSPPADPA